MRARFAGLVATVQVVLLAAHWFVYETWTTFQAGPADPSPAKLRVVLGLLSFTFVAASLLAFRYWNPAVRLFYRIAAVWLGFLNQFLPAAILCWVAYTAGRLFGFIAYLPAIAMALFGLAILTSIYGLLNAAYIRVRRITVRLPNLPPSWRGRVAALVSDVHLGHVNGSGFIRRIVARLKGLNPDIVFLTGDFYDGTRVDPVALASPLKELAPAFGTFFVTGNHEEFSDPAEYMDALSGAGVRVLNNEKTMVDGLQIVGLHYRDSLSSEHVRALLQSARLDQNRASILLSHAPHQLQAVETEGVSLQLSGHTHAGQLFPFTWIVKRIFGPHAYGLAYLGRLTTYTSSGVGTWGPPMRIGASPEIALLEFA